VIIFDISNLIYNIVLLKIIISFLLILKKLRTFVFFLDYQASWELLLESDL